MPSGSLFVQDDMFQDFAAIQRDVSCCVIMWGSLVTYNGTSLPSPGGHPAAPSPISRIFVGHHPTFFPKSPTFHVKVKSLVFAILVDFVSTSYFAVRLTTALTQGELLQHSMLE
jgi:hypothetical protein